MMKINRTQTPIHLGQRSSKNQGQVIRFRTAAILLRAIVGFLFLLFYIPAGAEDPSESAYGSLVITWAGVIDNGEGDEPPTVPLAACMC